MTTAPHTPAEDRPHYWQGEFLTDDQAGRRLDELDADVRSVLAEPRLSPLTVLAACDLLSAALRDPGSAQRKLLAEELAAARVDPAEAGRTLRDVAGALDREALETKLMRELGGTDPGRLARFDFRREIFEGWLPVGLLVHVAPGNAPAAGALSVIEGLLAGNVNAAKTSGGSRFTQQLLAQLAALDPSGAIARRVIVLAFPSSRTDWLERLCAPADAVAAWGGEEALAGVAKLVPAGCRLVDWGPKLSFAYLTEHRWADADTLRGIAADVCRLDQQACSSPQLVYLDTEDEEQVLAFAERFAAVLAEAVGELDLPERDPLESAEISNTVQVATLEQHLGLTRVHADPDGDWHVLADLRSALRASPLHRTVWVKPLPRTRIVEVLRPMRRYLQTVGLGADRTDTAALAGLVLTAGAQRVTVPGAMLDSYNGEPHDGVYALQRYSRRVDVQLDERFRSDACLDDLLGVRELTVPQVPVTGKDEFDRLQGDGARAEVFFRSGGSSGAPKLSAFAWDDYHEHMRSGAEGLLAAGFDPRTDRSMNLFFAGQLSGGFLSFHSVLETLRAVQFPMAGQEDHAMVARAIVDNRVDTLFGMPNYLLRVFTEGAAELRAYRGVRKVFFGGEHFPQRQQDWLREEFGVQLIRSAAYGSVDAGPLGYQCAHAGDRVHHLFSGVQTLEILDRTEDRPAAPGEPGRLVFTAHTRRGQRLDRYEVGDLGRWVEGDCPCGRRTPRFELLGRFGDIFRAGGHFLNYRRFVTIAQESLDHLGAVQLRVADGADSAVTTLTVLLGGFEPGERDSALLAEAFLADYPQLATDVVQDRVVDLRVEAVPVDALARTAASGKLREVVDLRVG
ncbi:acyl-CoA reductase [Kitasatospora viridis]|uniref:Phenylacetate-coenzyme A ligase PaaK-like adenylate-forming protein n=1 Tax=Kitasatospora viridis TaxID=281105 RepID=A0A561UPW0_9ACTN|nr:acyl-CoA reductase [Kitasatospora viridis]TWG01380.1 phenylacetate-coenzyme A ligase PaaK-like adenylate-forming protein [Kitasatospora viridis]